MTKVWKAWLVIIIGLVSFGLAIYQDGTTTHEIPIEPKHGGFMLQDPHPIEVKASTVPIHAGQDAIIQAAKLRSSLDWDPKIGPWPGNKVTIYKVSLDERSWQRELNSVPPGSKIIGEANIVDGYWHLPLHLQAGTTQFLAQDNTGVISKTEVNVVPQGEKVLSYDPPNPHFGDRVTVSGTGFRKDSTVWISLNKEEPTNNADRFNDYGIQPMSGGSFHLSFQMFKEMNGRTLASGE